MDVIVKWCEELKKWLFELCEIVGKLDWICNCLIFDEVGLVEWEQWLQVIVVEVGQGKCVGLIYDLVVVVYDVLISLYCVSYMFDVVGVCVMLEWYEVEYGCVGVVGNFEVQVKLFEVCKSCDLMVNVVVNGKCDLVVVE